MSYSRNGRFQQARPRHNRVHLIEQEFKCIQCHQYVSCAPAIAGVQNHNHCPACLWSHHLDWRQPGDRLSNCRAPMEPIALTTKHSRNKYVRERDGELMLVHRCTGCDTIVINRIAGDDSIAALLEVFDVSCSAVQPLQQQASVSSDLSILTLHDCELVGKRLFGDNPKSMTRGAVIWVE